MEFSMEGYPTPRPPHVENNSFFSNNFLFFLFCGLIVLKHILNDTSNFEEQINN